MYLMNRFPHKRNTNVTVGQTVYRIGPGGFICYPAEERAPLDVPDVDADRLVQGKAWSQLNWDPNDPKNDKRFVTPADYPKGSGLGRPPRTMERMRADYGLPDEPMKPLGRHALGAQEIGTGTSKDGSGGLSGVEASAPSDRGLVKSVDGDRDVQTQDLAQQRTKGTTHEEFAPDQMSGESAVGDGRAPSGAPSPSGVEGPPPPTNVVPLVSGVGDTTPTTNVVPGDMTPAAYPAKPVEGQHWPDPSADMKINYLKEMADAYGVNYAKSIGAKTLSARVHKAMYPGE